MKTAVEFLIKELQLDVFANDEEMATIIKAKEMENKFIEDYKIYKKYWEITAKLSITKDSKSK